MVYAMIIQRIPTGIPKFDELIEGGFPENSMILLVGYPGAGKTTFSAQFLYNGQLVIELRESMFALRRRRRHSLRI